LEELARRSGRPLQWGRVMWHEGSDNHLKQFAWLEDAHRCGLPMYAQAMSVNVSQSFTLADFNGYDTMPHWFEATLGSREERIAKLSDPARRPALKEGMAERPGYFEKVKVREVVHERDFPWEG